VARKLVSAYAVFENLGGTRDIVFYYQGGGADSVTGVAAAEADYIVDLLRNEKPMSYDAERRRLSTYTPEPVGEEETTLDLDAWLSSHPAISARIVWQDSSGAHPWSNWSAAQKSELRQAFELARGRGSIAVAEVPTNLVTLADTDNVVQVLAASDAWAYFKASVAQSLAIEIAQHVTWSLGGYSSAQLAELVDSREMFSWNASPAGYRINFTHGTVVPAPPAFSYRFLSTTGLIGFSRRDTLASVLGWCRANLTHFLGGWDTANMEDQWQYRGFPPMVRVIEGTIQTSHPTWGSAHRTAGCWGTTGFLRALLRSINIPVKLVTNAGHAQPWLMADASYLSHGDDPYNRLTTAVPAIPPVEILTDETKFNAWFGPGVSDADKAKNVGRRTLELALVYLPNYLLHAHCADQAAGTGHGSGQVFGIFSNVYTVDELEALDLWTRMDAKIAGFGGCAAVPP
jgi:hypothetical protein